MSRTKEIQSGVVILAAGASRRMGRPKMLLPWGTTSVLGHLIQQWEQLPATQIAVVHAANAAEICDELDRLRFPSANRIINTRTGQGMFSSIQCSAAWSGWRRNLEQWIISLGDQPYVRIETLRRLIDFAASHPGRICQPLRKGRRRHPVLLPGSCFRSLNGSPVGDFKEFLNSRGKELAGFESDDEGLDFDIDTPTDYEKAKEFYFRSGL